MPLTHHLSSDALTIPLLTIPILIVPAVRIEGVTLRGPGIVLTLGNGEVTISELAAQVRFISQEAPM